MKFYKGPNKKDATEEEIVDDILDRFDTAQQHISHICQEHQEYLDQYFGKMPPLPEWKKNTGASNLFIPLVEPLVDTTVAKMYLAFVSNDPFIQYSPDVQEAVLPARAMEQVVKHMFQNKMPNSRSTMWSWFNSTVLKGTGIVRVYHDKKSHNRVRVEKIPNPIDSRVPLFDNNGKPMMQEITEEIIDYRGIKLENIDITNFAADWNSWDFQKGWVELREFIDPEEYLTRVEERGYKELEEEELEALMKVPEDFQYDSIHINNKTYDHKDNKSVDFRTDRREKIELITYYGKSWINGIRQSSIITVARHMDKDKKSPLILGPVPFGQAPFAVMRYKPGSGEFVGRGQGAQLKGLQGQLNTTVNQQNDNIAFELNGGWIYDEGAVEDESMLDSKVGQHIKRADPNAKIDKIPRNPLPPESFIRVNDIQTWAEKDTGSMDLMRGQMPRKETAFTTNLMNQNAGQRTEAILEIALGEAIQNMGDIIKQQIIEFYANDENIVIPLTKKEVIEYQEIFNDVNEVEINNQFLTISVGFLDAAYSASAQVSALKGDDRTKSQELLQLFQLAAPMAQTGWMKKDGSVEGLDLSYIVREYAKLNKIEDLRGAFITLLTKEQVEQQRQAQLAQQQAEAQQQGALPQELGGQSQLQPPNEQVAQQQGVAQEITEEDALLEE